MPLDFTAFHLVKGDALDLVDKINAMLDAVETQVNSVFVDATLKIDTVGLFAGRSAFDAQPAGFVYLSTNGDGALITTSVVFVKLSATSGDWSLPAQFQGDDGAISSVGGTGTVNGITLSGTVTSSGVLTLGGTLSGVSLTTQVTGILPQANGGTNNAFFRVSGPATSSKTFTFPNASCTVLTTNAAVTVSQGGTGRTTGATAYGLIACGTTTTGAQQTLPAGLTTQVLVGGGASALPVWTTATGSGAPVRAISPALVTPVLGTPSSGDLTNCTTDGTNLVGYRNVPQNSRSADYTCAITDAGKHIFHPSADTTARNFIIPSNATVAFPIGTELMFVNENGAGVITIAVGADTMRLAGAGTTGNRTLAANGVATALKVTSTSWLISGVGLT